MNGNAIRKKYLDFFSERGHKVIPSAPLVPQNDPTTLFNSSGMQPLVPYLLGQKHPLGTRLANSQKAIRTQDIDEVGDNRHTTFFEMLGNWSLGDYFKREQLSWIFELLTGELALDPERLFVTVFEGNAYVPRDEESIGLWKSLFRNAGIQAEIGTRIFLYPAEKNWWSRSGTPENMPVGEPGGPDSEVFFDFGSNLKLHEQSPYKDSPCHPNCDCGRYIEIANSVFMEYTKNDSGGVTLLQQKNVDFGGGLERITAAVQKTPDVFGTDIFKPIIDVIESLSSVCYGQNGESTRAMRVIADHVRGAVMLITDGVQPSNKAQGYVLRRLIRRALLFGRQLGFSADKSYIQQFVDPIVMVYAEAYPEVLSQSDKTKQTLVTEAEKFGKSLDKGLREIEKMDQLTGSSAFRLYETYGFPWELTVEIAAMRGMTVDRQEFENEFEKHRNVSRTAAQGMFKGGLLDHSQETTRLHTATHLLHQALRRILGNHVEQKGSNITKDRLRFDFSHPERLTEEQRERVEELVNEHIRRNHRVTTQELSFEEAVGSGALAFFGERYPERVRVYTIGDYSKEICGGPHVAFTGELGKFTIGKEESLGSGIRRIYATLSEDGKSP